MNLPNDDLVLGFISFLVSHPPSEKLTQTCWIWSCREEVRERTTTRKEESDKVRSYLRTPLIPTPHPSPRLVVPLTKPPGKIFGLDLQKGWHFTQLCVSNMIHKYDCSLVFSFFPPSFSFFMVMIYYVPTLDLTFRMTQGKLFMSAVIG